MARQTTEPAATMKRGFYPDPDGSGGLRWWTGKRWGTSTANPGGEPVTPKPQAWYRVWVNLGILFVALLVIATIVSQTFGPH